MPRRLQGQQARPNLHEIDGARAPNGSGASKAPATIGLGPGRAARSGLAGQAPERPGRIEPQVARAERRRVGVVVGDGRLDRHRQRLFGQRAVRMALEILREQGARAHRIALQAQGAHGFEHRRRVLAAAGAASRRGREDATGDGVPTAARLADGCRRDGDGRLFRRQARVRARLGQRRRPHGRRRLASGVAAGTKRS